MFGNVCAAVTSGVLPPGGRRYLGIPISVEELNGVYRMKQHIEHGMAHGAISWDHGRAELELLRRSSVSQ